MRLRRISKSPLSTLKLRIRRNRVNCLRRIYWFSDRHRFIFVVRARAFVVSITKIAETKHSPIIKHSLVSYSLICVKSRNFRGVFLRFLYGYVEVVFFCSNKTITLVFCEGQRMSLDEVTVIHQAISVVKKTLPLGPLGPYISILSVTARGFHSAHYSHNVSSNYISRAHYKMPPSREIRPEIRKHKFLLELVLLWRG